MFLFVTVMAVLIATMSGMAIHEANSNSSNSYKATVRGCWWYCHNNFNCNSGWRTICCVQTSKITFLNKKKDVQCLNTQTRTI